MFHVHEEVIEPNLNIYLCPTCQFHVKTVDDIDLALNPYTSRPTMKQMVFVVRAIAQQEGRAADECRYTYISLVGRKNEKAHLSLRQESFLVPLTKTIVAATLKARPSTNFDCRNGETDQKNAIVPACH